MFHLLWEAIIGLIVGALAKFIMPGKDPGGIFITMLIGVAGALLATFIGSHVACIRRASAPAFSCRCSGAIVLLAIYRLFKGKQPSRRRATSADHFAPVAQHSCVVSDGNVPPYPRVPQFSSLSAPCSFQPPGVASSQMRAGKARPAVRTPCVPGIRVTELHPFEKPALHPLGVIYARQNRQNRAASGLRGVLHSQLPGFERLGGGICL